MRVGGFVPGSGAMAGQISEDVDPAGESASVPQPNTNVVASPAQGSAKSRSQNPESFRRLMFRFYPVSSDPVEGRHESHGESSGGSSSESGGEGSRGQGDGASHSPGRSDAPGGPLNRNPLPEAKQPDGLQPDAMGAGRDAGSSDGATAQVLDKGKEKMPEPESRPTAALSEGAAGPSAGPAENAGQTSSQPAEAAGEPSSTAAFKRPTSAGIGSVSASLFFWKNTAKSANLRAAAHNAFRPGAAPLGYMVGRDVDPKREALPPVKGELPVTQRGLKDGIKNDAQIASLASQMVGRTNHNHIKALAGRVDSAQKPTESDAGASLRQVLGGMVDRQSFDEELKGLFAQSGSAEQKATLDRLADRLAEIPAEDTFQAVPFERPVAVAKAVALATGGDIGKAAEVVAQLEKGLDPTRREDAGSETWRAAQILARSANGFEALEALNRISPPEPYDGLNVTPRLRQSQALKVFLQASGVLDWLGSAPESSGGTSSSAKEMAGKACRAATLVFANPSKPVGELLRPQQCLSEYFAWRQGFRDNAPNTPFDKANKRLHKAVTQWVRRAERRNETNFSLDIGLRPFGKKKSPLTAAELGLHATHLSMTDDVAKKISQTDDAEKARAIQEPMIPSSMTRDGIRDLLKDLNGTIAGGNGIRLKDGGRAGIRSNIGPVVGPVVVAPLLAVSRSRTGLVEFAGRTHGNQLFIGVERDIAGELGVQVRGGISALGGSASVSVTGSVAPREGVVIDSVKRFDTKRNLLKVETADPSGDPGATKKVDAFRVNMESVLDTMFSTDAAERSTPAARDELWQKLAEKFADSEDVSIGYVDMKTSSVGTEASGAVYGGPKLGPVGLSVRGQVGVEASRQAETTFASTGNFGMQQSKAGAVRTLSAGVGVNIQVPQQSGVALSQAGIAELKATGDSGKTRLVRINMDRGKVRDMDTYHDTEFRSARALGESVSQNAEAWKNALGEDAFKAIVEQMRSDSTPNNIFVERWGIRPKVAREMDAARTRLDLLKREAEQAAPEAADRLNEQIKHVEDTIARAIAHPNSWEPQQLSTREVPSIEKTVGPKYLVELTTTTSSQSTRWTHKENLIQRPRMEAQIRAEEAERGRGEAGPSGT